MRPILLAVLCLFVPTALADQLFVPSDEYPTIRAAVAAAMDGDEVILRAGDHHPRDILMPNKAIVIRGETTDASRVRLVGTGDFVAPSRAFSFLETSSSEIIIRDLTITDYQNSTSGGAVFIRSSSPTFINCTFSDNWATNWGAVAVARGGAVFETNSTARFLYCRFYGNIATGIICDGGVAEGFGGAVSTSGEVSFQSCEFKYNLALGDCAGTGRGGAIHARGGHTVLTNCAFDLNGAIDGTGQEMLCDGATMTVHNTTFNVRPSRSSIVAFDSILRVTNSIIWGHPSPLAISGGAAFVRYSNIQGGYSGEGNIDADPLFEPGTYRLLPGSPCIDAGNTNLLPADEFDLDGDGDTTEPIPFDADGFARAVDDPATPDTGMGFPVVDMGAFEYQPPCRVDMDGDGELTIFDFLAFFNAFDDADPVADFDGDGEFTVFDFLAFQNEFDAGCP